MSAPHREMYYRSGDDLRLYARIYDGPDDSAPAVLCLHGLTRNSRDFEELAPHLQTRYRVIAPDFRGRGSSARDPNAENYQPMVYVRDTLALLETAGAASCAIIGTSLGGLVAMMLAAAHRSLVAGIVLNDVGPELDPAGVERIKRYAGRMPPAQSWTEATQQTRTIYGCAWPDLLARALGADGAARLSRGCRRHTASRCRSDDRREASRLAGRHARSVAALGRSRRCADTGDTRRPVRYSASGRVRENEGRKAGSAAIDGAESRPRAAIGRTRLPAGDRRSSRRAIYATASA